MDVVGENEALRQFFEGQLDVQRALEMDATMDTSLQDEFIVGSNLEVFGALQSQLPDSPPDSGSEPCSSPQFKAAYHPSTSGLAGLQPLPSFPSARPASTFPGQCLETSNSRMNSAGQLCGLHQDCSLKAGNTGTPWNNWMPSNGLGFNYSCPPLQTSLSPSMSWMPKKRKHSEILDDPPECLTWISNADELAVQDSSSDVREYDSDDGQNAASVDKGHRPLAWQPYQRPPWSTLFNHHYEKLPDVGYHIVTNKGFNFSATDDAFVCQKKNHFQITVYIRMVGNPTFVKTHLGLKPIEKFYLKPFGIKMEAPNQVITIEQSQSDRSKKPFYPVDKSEEDLIWVKQTKREGIPERLDLPGDQVTKVTLARLHFSETTANNMRKKGKPNPDQRYFMFVTGLYAVSQDQSYLVVAHVSERIIVRASNPGQFENDSDMFWHRGLVPETVTCHGRVGINTDAPDEALVVCGNMQVTGSVMHPSDSRVKQNIQEVDAHEQLRRIAQMRLVEYDYKPEFASVMGINQIHETGVIAQEVQELLPQAVKEVGDFTCRNGGKVHNFLMVDKDQIFMENVGAVKQLCKLTNNLEVRIEELEAWNKKLARLKRINSLRSSTTSEKNPVRRCSQVTSCLPSRKSVPIKPSKVSFPEKTQAWSSTRIFQLTVIALVAVMALCVMTISTLYVFGIPEQEVVQPEPSNSTSLITLPPTTTLTVTRYSTMPSDSKPAPVAAEVNFCGILPCHTTYCCPLHWPARTNRSYRKMKAKERNKRGELPEQSWIEKPDLGNDWIDTTISSMQILETQQKIDHRYCSKNLQCRSGNYSYVVPLNKYTPVKVKISLEITTTEPLIIFQCKVVFGNLCSSRLQARDNLETFPETTQGYQHIWVLPVASMYDSAYHFRVAAPDLADCSTDPNYAGIFFTDYFFYFYRKCS